MKTRLCTTQVLSLEMTNIIWSFISEIKNRFMMFLKSFHFYSNLVYAKIKYLRDQNVAQAKNLTKVVILTAFSVFLHLARRLFLTSCQLRLNYLVKLWESNSSYTMFIYFISNTDLFSRRRKLRSQQISGQYINVIFIQFALSTVGWNRTSYCDCFLLKFVFCNYFRIMSYCFGSRWWWFHSYSEWSLRDSRS